MHLMPCLHTCGVPYILVTHNSLAFCVRLSGFDKQQGIQRSLSVQFDFLYALIGMCRQ